MEIEEIIENYLPKIREHILPLMLGLIGFVLLATGLISSLNSKPEEIIFKPANNNLIQASTKKIFIDVSGAVIKPGVYSLNDGSRIQDALIAASGLSQNADRDWVSKNINLAQKLVDGSKIYVPKLGEEVTSIVLQGSSQIKGNLININSATLQDLDTLPSIGVVTAQKIIDNRPYSSVNDLLSKKVVTQKVFDKLKDSISVY